MKQIQFCLLLVFSTSLGLYADNQTDIKFVNTGAMNVKGIMYVNCDMQMKNSNTSITRDVQVILDGTTELKGSFYHDAEKHVFVTENNDWSIKSRPSGIASSTGKFRFVGQNSGDQRYISSSDTVNFDRVSNYISFPNLEITTNDQIYIPSTIGLDARTIKRESKSTGALYLASNIVSEKSMMYDASLRITGDYDNVENKYVYSVAPGVIIIEERVREFHQTSNWGKCTIQSLSTISTSRELFVDIPIFSTTVQADKSQKKNWVVDNSYTSALSTEEIVKYLMNTGYVTYSMLNGSFVAGNLPEIHSMSVFTITASDNNTKSKAIEIGPEFQIHAGGIALTESFSEENADRFEMHSKSQEITDINEIATGWYVNNNQNYLIIRDLDESFVGTLASVYSASGVLQIQQSIRDIPEKHINISMLPEGIYLLSLQNKTVKFIK